jgi:hypothetical protein
MIADPNVPPLSPQRRFVTPVAGETLEALAARVLPEAPAGAAADNIRSWNLHIFAMRRPAGLLLCSDVVFVEPPRASAPVDQA